MCCAALHALVLGLLLVSMISRSLLAHSGRDAWLGLSITGLAPPVLLSLTSTYDWALKCCDGDGVTGSLHKWWYSG